MSELDLKGALNPYEQLPGAPKPSEQSLNQYTPNHERAPKTPVEPSGNIVSVRSIVFSKLQEQEPNF